MDVKEMAALVRQMRDAQRAYFAERDGNRKMSLLTRAKQQESLVDGAVKDALEPPGPGLFDAQQGNLP
jgi:hypothetical protein